MPRVRCRPGQIARREGRRLLAVALGFAIVLGVLLGGSHYFYCPLMGAVVSEPCTSAPRGDASTIAAPDCCQTVTIGTLPSALGAAPGPELPALPLVAVLQPSEVKGDAWLPLATLAVIEPTGPPPLRATQRAARLSVFLI
jgi:hypothetical protein